MIRTFARFAWDITIPNTAQQPYAETEVQGLIAILRASGLDVTEPEDAEYAWDFYAKLTHLQMYCRLGLVENWLLTCHPQLGFTNWLFRRSWEPEQQEFVERLTKELEADDRISNLRWFTQAEWDRGGG